MRDSWLECGRCAARFDVSPLFFGCPQCLALGKVGVLEMQYETGSLTPSSAPGLWRWSDLLPRVQESDRVTLYEGNTPLIPIRFDDLPGPVYLKNETVNPTWSWKDRPNCISVSMAKRFGFTRVTSKSTGNHGNATAAYAASAGMQATILCNPDTPELQLALMTGYGAQIILGGMQDRTILQMIREQAYFPCTILCPQAGYSNPFGVEGFKTIAFEIVASLGGRAPDRVFVATGSGDGIYGIWKGFRELAARGLIASAPRMIGCQPHGANSAAIAWRKNSRHVEPLASVNTEARSVAELATGNHALRAVYESEGEFLEASEIEIADASRTLSRAGFALELASSLTYACARKAKPDKNEAWVLVGSGAAVKWPETILRNITPVASSLTGSGPLSQSLVSIQA